MKIAIFSDIHGNLQALEAIISDIRKKQFDKVICLGDSIAIGPSSKECLELILKEGYEYVLGNHEEYFINGTNSFPEVSVNEVKHQNWVKNTLNEKLKLELINKPYSISFDYLDKVYTLIHYARKDNKFIYINEERDAKNLDNMFSDINGDVILYGHEHHLEQSIIKGKKTYICVGSSGCRKDNLTYYSVLNIEKSNYAIEKVNLVYDREKFIKTLYSINYPDKDMISRFFFGIKEGQ